MTKLTILSAATVLSMMGATPVFAQAAYQQQEPSAVASIYPNASIYRAARVYSPPPSLGALAYLPPGKSHARRHVTHR